MRQLVKNETGAAMVVAILVVFVMFILGTTLWSYSTADTIHVARDEIRLQAYYLARSGAEAGLQAWRESSSTNKPSGDALAMYLEKDTGEFVKEDASTNHVGSFDVNIGSSGSTTIITSVGVVDDISQTVKVFITAAYQYGDELGWYNVPSGQIDPGVYKVNGAVLFKENPNNNLTEKINSLKNPANGPATYEAEAMFFYYPMDTANSDSLTLIAEIIVFEEELKFGNNGEMLLQLFPGAEKGIVFFNEVYGQNKNDPFTAISNQAFYFYETIEVHNLKTAADVQAAIDEEKIELIMNPVKPDPSGYYTITWN